MVKYLVGLTTQFRNKKCVTYLAGLLIIIFEKSPSGQLNCRVAKYFWGLSPKGSLIRPGQLIGTEEYQIDKHEKSCLFVPQNPTVFQVFQVDF